MGKRALKFQGSPILPLDGFAKAQEEGRIPGAELIPIDDIVEDPAYRSLRRNLHNVAELAAKMQQQGQLVPILLWLRRGSYILLSGHRRVAALRANRAKTAKAIVYSDRQLSEADALDIAIADNVDRDNLSKLDLAALAERLGSQGMNQRDIADKLRVSLGYINYFLRLLLLPNDIQQAVDQERLSLPAAMQLEQASDEGRRRVLLSAEREGPLSAGDVRRFLNSPTAHQTVVQSRERKTRWSREASIHTGLVWLRKRGDECQFRIHIPPHPTDEERARLRSFFSEQLEGLR
ncbi:MAG: ParB/RepB/Spo0J family partition protein [Proteobacteria bacterium]|nr:ParB/RepB/Spo0J family partition protein [Pseudomonadota bacterium]